MPGTIIWDTRFVDKEPCGLMIKMETMVHQMIGNEDIIQLVSRLSLMTSSISPFIFMDRR